MSTMATLLACAAALAAGPPGRENAATPIKAITAPSEDLTLSFIQPGRIAAVFVKEADKVKPAQLLVQMDDSLQRAQVAMLAAKVADTTAIRIAELQLARSRTLLQKLQAAFDANAAPQRELEDGKMDAAMNELTLEMRRFERAQAKAKHEEAKLLLDRRLLHSPAAGRAERIMVRPGESVDALAPVLRIVRIDPLWIDTPVGLAQARKLKAGQVALVRLPETNAPAVGKVIRIASVADAASETLEVRVELPNPTTRPAGEQVTVTFPSPGASGPAGRPAPPAAKKNPA